MLDPLDKESADGRILYLYLGGAVVFNAFAEAKAKGEPMPSDLAAVFRSAAQDSEGRIDAQYATTAGRHFLGVAAFAEAQARGGSVDAGLQAAQDQDGRIQRGLNALTAWLWPKTPKPSKGQAHEG